MGRELGRISGPLLADNLKRNGQNLAFDNSLLYFDVNNNYVGINSLGGSSALTIGTTKNDNSVGTSTLNTVNLIGTTTNIGNFTISANTIQHLTGGITISPNQSSNPTIVTPGLSTSNLYLSGNTYTTTVTNDSVNFTPNGTGSINFANSGTVQVTVNANLHATGNITWDGNITFGTNASERITIPAEVNSDIIPVPGTGTLVTPTSQIFTTQDGLTLTAQDGTILYTNPAAPYYPNTYSYNLGQPYIAGGGGGSALISNAALSYLSVPANSAFTLGTANHTIEFWMYQTSRGLYDTAWTYNSGASTHAVNQYYFNTGTSQFFLILGNGSGFLTSTNLNGSPPSLNAWHHYAIVRNSTTITLYIDGTASGTISVGAQNITAQTGPMYIGGNGANLQTINGYITNFRVVNGVALYTSNFTPSTNPLTASGYTTGTPGGSISFTTRGNSSTATYLTLSPVINFGTNSWTVEAFVNFQDNLTQDIIGTSSTPGCMIYWGSTIFWVQSTYGVDINWTTTSPTTNTWYHIAVTYDGTYVNVWINGTQLGRKSWSGGTFGTSNQIGANSWSGSSAYGSNMYLANIRIVVGSVVYTTSSSTITVPTALLTTVTNTQLLLQVNSSGTAYTDTSSTETVTNYRTSYSSSTPFSYNSALLLLETNSAGLLTDSSTNNFTVTNNNGVTFNSATPFGSGGGQTELIWANVYAKTGTTSVSVTASGTITATKLWAGNIGVTGNSIGSNYPADNLYLSPNGTGYVSFNGTKVFNGNNIYVPSSTNNLLINSTGTGYVQFADTNGLVTPVGTTSNRPASPVQGQMRFNTDLGYEEIYDAGAGGWIAVYGSTGQLATITDIDNDSILYSIIFGR